MQPCESSFVSLVGASSIAGHSVAGFFRKTDHGVFGDRHKIVADEIVAFYGYGVPVAEYGGEIGPASSLNTSSEDRKPRTFLPKTDCRVFRPKGDHRIADLLVLPRYFAGKARYNIRTKRNTPVCIPAEGPII